MPFKIIRKNCCGLDVHKTWIYACIGITDPNGRTEYFEKRFSSFSKGLRNLSEWLSKHNCKEVCMESTGKYWIPVFNVLETTCYVELAHPMEVTFHRAFDELKQNPLEALEDIIGCGCDRILTSGLQPTAELGMETIHELVEHAAGRISIMPGGGITPTNVARIVEATGVNEVHGSCKTTLTDGTVQTDPKIVNQLINALSR